MRWLRPATTACWSARSRPMRSRSGCGLRRLAVASSLDENQRIFRERLEAAVPLYLGRFKYSADAIRAMIENPQDRGAAATQAAETLGCKLHGIWWAFGDHDGMFLLEAQDNVAVVALAMAVGASGQISTETTVLLDMDEAQDAMRRAATASFRPPS